MYTATYRGGPLDGQITESRTRRFASARKPDGSPRAPGTSLHPKNMYVLEFTPVEGPPTAYAPVYRWRP